MEGYITWFYNWATNPGNLDGILEEYGVDFVPMAWNHLFNEESMRAYYTNHPEAKYLLGFNEPNFIDQANMTPSLAAAQWPVLEAIADEFGLEIVGPAVNYCGNCVSEGGTTYTNPFDYLDDFFAACPDCRVDYIAVHNYMCYAEPLIDYLEEFKKYGKKIWLTEFACGDQASITLSMQENLLLGALDYMDNDTMIYKYAWFIGRTNGSDWNIDIFESEGGKLTELGEIYLYFNAIHDTSYYTPVPARIEAESYSVMSGIQLEKTMDFDGLANLGWIDAGDFMEYNIIAPDSGDYYLYLRLSANQDANMEIHVNGDSVGFLDIPYTGGWQSWETFNKVIPLGKGNSRLKLISSTGNFNINWLRVEDRTNLAPDISAGDDIYLELPANTATLNATASDGDDDELIFRWIQTAGPSCTITTPDSISAIISCSSEGNYTFKITVSDGFETASDLIVVHVTGQTGVSIQKIRNITVYPNPFQDKLHIIPGDVTSPYTIDIVNMAGQSVQKREFNHWEGELEMDLSDELPGIYVVKLTSIEKVGVIRILKE